MNMKRDGGAAFPRGPYLYGEDGKPLHYRKDQTDPGMSLRDYFAAKALQGDLSALQIDGRRFGLLVAMAESEGITMSQAIAKEAYEQADAMIEARDK